MIQALVVVAVLSAAIDAGLVDVVPVTPLHECPDNTYDKLSVKEFCGNVCSECVCKDNTLQGTCYDTCVAFWFQDAAICGLGISFNFPGFAPQWTSQSGNECAENAAANAGDWSPADTCGWVCACCKPNDVNCVNDCQTAFFPWFYDQVLCNNNIL